MSDSATPWTVSPPPPPDPRQAPMSLGFSRQESWSGLPCSPLSCQMAQEKTWDFCIHNPDGELSHCTPGGREIGLPAEQLGSPLRVPPELRAPCHDCPRPGRRRLGEQDSTAPGRSPTPRLLLRAQDALGSS